jgi:hypothetical protein
MLIRTFSFNNRIRTMRYAFVLLTMMVATQSVINAQNLSTKDIQDLKLGDFQAPVPAGASHPVNINVTTFYNFDSLVKVGDNQYTLKVKTSVDPNRKISFFDQTRIRKDEVPHVLNHEKGHVIISFIGANIIAKELNAKIYTADYAKEIDQEFHKLLAKHSVMHIEYDKATNHSTDYINQKIWDQKLMKMFEDTCMPKQDGE